MKFQYYISGAKTHHIYLLSFLHFGFQYYISGAKTNQQVDGCIAETGFQYYISGAKTTAQTTSIYFISYFNTTLVELKRK